jgi:hypothetical protein
LADVEAPDCGGLPQLQSKSRPTFESHVPMTSLLILQNQGEGDFTGILDGSAAPFAGRQVRRNH